MLKKLEEYSQPCSDQERSARLCNKSQSARCRKTESAFSASCNSLNNEVRGGNQRNMWCLRCAHVVPMLCLCCAYVVPLCNFFFATLLSNSLNNEVRGGNERNVLPVFWKYWIPNQYKNDTIIIGFMWAFKTLTKRPILVFKKTRIHSPPKHVSLSFSFKPIRSNQGVWHQAGLIKGPGILDH